jgi:hypothetical protein
MSSPAARRVVVGAGLAVAFGIGISIIISPAMQGVMAPAMQGVKSQAALNAPSVAASSAETAVNPPAEDSAASAREAATAPVAPPAVTTPGPQASNPPLAVANDGRITAQVRSSIASLAPGSNIDVKAMSGIVALAGSVPNQDVVEQARQAAQQVPGVRQVDTSALLVANR